MSNKTNNNKSVTAVIGLLGRIGDGVAKAKGRRAKLNVAVDEICHFTSWPVGHVYFWDENNKLLIPSGIWHLGDISLYKTFRDLTEKTVFKSGEGLPGRVMERGEAVWISNLVADPNFPRAVAGIDIGLRSGIGVPVFTQDKIFAVMEFYIPLSIEKNPQTLKMLEEVGSILGYFPELQEAEDALERQAQLNETTMDTMVDGLVVIDEKGVIQNVNRACADIFGYHQKNIIGKNVSMLMNSKDKKGHDGYLKNYQKTGVGKILGIGPREVVGKRKDGSLVDLELAINSYRDGIKVVYVGSLRDITRRKEVEGALHRKEQHQRTILNTVSDCLVVINTKGEILGTNPASKEIFGYDEEELIGKNVRILIPKALHIKHNNGLAKFVRTGKSSLAGKGPTEVPGLTKDGKEIFLELTINVAQDGDDTIFIGSMRDITEHKAAEEKISELQKRFQLITETATDIISLRDATGKVVYISPSFKRTLGYDEKLALGKTSLGNILHPDDLKKRTKILKENIFEKNTSFTYEVRMRTKEGNYLWFESQKQVTKNAAGEIEYMVTVARNIDERKKIEEKLKKQELLTKTTMETMVDGLVAIDDKGTVLSINQACADIFGYNEEEIVGKNIKMLTNRGDRKQHDGYLKKYKKTGKGKIIGVGPREVVGQKKDGTEIPIELAINFHEIEGKKIFVGSLRDNTLRKKAEEKIRELQEKMRLITDNATDIVSLRDTKGNLIFLSPAFKRQLGHEVKDYMGSASWKNIVHPDDRDTFVKNFFETVFERGENYTAQLRLKTKSGKYLWFESQVRPVKNVAGKVVGAVSISRNITEQRKMEDQLRQAKKMEAVGQLTGGVAHEFNNILTTILGSLRVLETLDMQDDTRVSLDYTIEAAKKGATLTEHLLKFSREEKLTPEILDPNEIMAEINPMLELSVGKDLKYRFQTGAEKTHINVDKAELEDALLALITNAKEATQSAGGTIKVQTAHAHIREDIEDEISSIPAGDYCLITVADTGAGMSDDVFEKALDPFFTTKTVGDGAGLGLSSVFGFLQQSGGHLQIDSEPGFGTTINMYFPLVEAKPEEDKKAKEADTPRTILLVENDDMKILLATKALGGLSENVIVARTLEKASTQINTQHNISLMVTQMTLDGDNVGRKLVQDFQTRFKDSAILLVSDHPEKPQSLVDKSNLMGDVLTSPYTLSTLIIKADNLLRAIEK